MSSLNILVSSVLSFLPWCKSNSSICSPVCFGTCITLNAPVDVCGIIDCTFQTCFLTAALMVLPVAVLLFPYRVLLRCRQHQSFFLHKSLCIFEKWMRCPSQIPFFSGSARICYDLEESLWFIRIACLICMFVRLAKFYVSLLQVIQKISPATVLFSNFTVKINCFSCPSSTGFVSLVFCQLILPNNLSFYRNSSRLFMSGIFLC